MNVPDKYQPGYKKTKKAWEFTTLFLFLDGLW
jgi:hypothetical protein